MKVYSALFGILAVCVLGCTQEAPLPPGVAKLVPAEGVALYQGQPLANATVSFFCRDGQHSASAVTNEQGEFVAKAFPHNEGVVPDEYKVVVTKTEDVEVDDGDNDPETHRTQSHSVVPKKYTNTSTTDLGITVPEDGATDLSIELVD